MYTHPSTSFSTMTCEVTAHFEHNIMTLLYNPGMLNTILEKLQWSMTHVVEYTLTASQ